MDLEQLMSKMDRTVAVLSNQEDIVRFKDSDLARDLENLADTCRYTYLQAMLDAVASKDYDMAQRYYGALMATLSFKDFPKTLLDALSSSAKSSVRDMEGV